jgi:hypothetical protein
MEIRHYVDESEKLYRDLKNAYSYFFDEREKEMEKARKKAGSLHQSIDVLLHFPGRPVASDG